MSLNNKPSISTRYYKNLGYNFSLCAIGKDINRTAFGLIWANQRRCVLILCDKIVHVCNINT